MARPTGPTDPVRGASRSSRPKPDPRPMRLAIGMTGLAAATAMATAIAVPPSAGTTTVTTVVTGGAQPAPSVHHVVRYVQLAPGQTAPPKAAVKAVPTPAPKVVVVTTRQSGKP